MMGLMIPEFNSDGNLPEGIYQTAEGEFLNRFATGSARRKWLGERLKDILLYPHQLGNSNVYSRVGIRSAGNEGKTLLSKKIPGMVRTKIQEDINRITTAST